MVEVVVFSFESSKSQPLPDRVERRKIEKQVAQAHHEHLIVFCDGPSSSQVWQWVDRDDGRTRFLQHQFSPTQAGQALLDKRQTP